MEIPLPISGQRSLLVCGDVAVEAGGEVWGPRADDVDGAAADIPRGIAIPRRERDRPVTGKAAMNVCFSSVVGPGTELQKPILQMRTQPIERKRSVDTWI